MPTIQLTAEETALWREVSSRGDAFRRAFRDRALELAVGQRETIDVLDSRGAMVQDIEPVQDHVPGEGGDSRSRR